MTFFERHKVRLIVNAIGTSTIVGANVAPPEVIAAAAEALAVNCEIDELQRVACRAIAQATGAEAGCVTSSASSGIAIATAACMTGPDFSKILRLPDSEGLPNEVLLQQAHDVNFGAPISQMVRLAGARVVRLGAANHCDEFHLRGGLSPRTAAILHVVNGAVSSAADLVPIEQSVAIASAANVPVIVDAAAETDVRPFLQAGASIVIASGHKAMGAPTSGLLCGRKELIRACYMQNWGIGRAMKVGKEGIAGLIAAVERWYSGDLNAETEHYAAVAALFAAKLEVHPTDAPHRIRISVTREARHIANLLREGDPPIWVNDATGRSLLLDLRNLTLADAAQTAERILWAMNSKDTPVEDVPYHDLYWSEARLLRWPD
jgi:D-glucosaminate-6-phosphate ammonia-lyase